MVNDKVEKIEADEDIQASNTVLIEADKYLKTGAHIGTRFKTGEMRKYIYKERKDKLKVLNVQTLDERIKVTANFLNYFPAEKIGVVSRKLYGHTAAKKFAEIIGAKTLVGRFIPGTFTNPSCKQFFEPKIILTNESDSDFQAIKEASMIKIPVISLVSTNNSIKNVDLVIPVNNKGRKSIALVYWLLAREVLKLKGVIQKDSDFTYSIEDFEYKLSEGQKEELEQQQMRMQKEGRMRRGRKGFTPRRRTSNRDF